MSTALVLGVDAGGTKTDAVLARAADGAMVASVRTGGANHESLGWPGAEAALSAALAAVLESCGAGCSDIVASAWGLAGLDWEADGSLYEDIVDRLGVHGPRAVVNDAWLALEAAELATGLAVVAGTGMVAVGRAAGRTARTLGVGAGHGEWGSGGDVVRAAAEAVAQEHLGLGPATALTARALGRSGARDVPEYLRRVWREGRPTLLPPDVWEVAAAVTPRRWPSPTGLHGPTLPRQRAWYVASDRSPTWCSPAASWTRDTSCCTRGSPRRSGSRCPVSGHDGSADRPSTVRSSWPDGCSTGERRCPSWRVVSRCRTGGCVQDQADSLRGGALLDEPLLRVRRHRDHSRGVHLDDDVRRVESAEPGADQSPDASAGLALDLGLLVEDGTGTPQGILRAGGVDPDLVGGGLGAQPLGRPTHARCGQLATPQPRELLHQYGVDLGGHAHSLRPGLARTPASSSARR